MAILKPITKALAKLVGKKLDRFYKTSTATVQVNNIKFGRWYVYRYASKYFEMGKLKFYDRLPMVLIIGKSNTHLWGLNFHYMDRKMRHSIIQRIKSKYPKEWANEQPIKGLKTWAAIKKEFRFIKPEFLIHQYIRSRIYGKIVNIPNREIEEFIDTPSENFIGIDMEKVFAKWRRK